MDSQLVEALLAGDEEAFGTVVMRYNRAMVQLAMAYVPSRAIAEEVVQEAWMAMVSGLSSFKGQSSLKTWIFGILLNRAKTKGHRERRSIPFSSLNKATSKSDREISEDWVVDQGRFTDDWLVGWGRSTPDLSPEDRALSSELRLCLEEAIRALPFTQRAVIVLRDVEGWSSGEICDLLSISPENQRVRLHRARLRVRAAVEAYLSRR